MAHTTGTVNTTYRPDTCTACDMYAEPCGSHDTLPTDDTLTIADLVPNVAYTGDDTCYDLNGMTFYLVAANGPHVDMADHDTEFYICTVNVGSETWVDVLIPTDATFTINP